jgi:hypothetical protein
MFAFIGWESGHTWVAGLKGRWDSCNLSAPRSHPRFSVSPSIFPFRGSAAGPRSLPHILIRDFW